MLPDIFLDGISYESSAVDEDIVGVFALEDRIDERVIPRSAIVNADFSHCSVLEKGEVDFSGAIIVEGAEDLAQFFLVEGEDCFVDVAVG